MLDVGGTINQKLLLVTVAVYPSALISALLEYFECPSRRHNLALQLLLYMAWDWHL